MTWLQPSPAKRKPKLRQWKAPSLTEAGLDIDGLSYLVVEEIVGSVAGLSVSPWPGADWRGRLRFPIENDPVEIAVDIDAFCEFLNESLAGAQGFITFVRPRSGPERAEERQLRIGTTFAVEIRKEGTRWTKPFGRWIRRIHDITADARVVAKLASYGALTEHWDRRKATDLHLMRPEDELEE